MSETLAQLTQLDEEHFGQVVTASPKKFREQLFRVAGIKGKSGGAYSLSSSKKNETRIRKLHEALLGGLALEDDIIEELIRNYLYTKRELLGDALDHFGVEHDNGLTDDELTFIADLTPDKGQELKKLLKAKHESKDVELYLTYMSIPH